MVKVVNGILDSVESGEIGALLKKAPNWGKVKPALDGLRGYVPPSVDEVDETDFPLYFHLETGHEDVLREFFVGSYGVSREISEMIVEG